MTRSTIQRCRDLELPWSCPLPDGLVRRWPCCLTHPAKLRKDRPVTCKAWAQGDYDPVRLPFWPCLAKCPVSPPEHADDGPRAQHIHAAQMGALIDNCHQLFHHFVSRGLGPYVLRANRLWRQQRSW